MHPAAQRLVSAVVALSLVACTSLQPLPGVGTIDRGTDSQKALSPPVLADGSTVRVRQADGTTTDLIVISADITAVRGRSDGREVQIAWSDVTAIELRRFDPGRTALLVLAIVALGQLAHGLAKVLNPPPP